MYISDRQSIAAPDRSEEPYALETRLDRLFWDETLLRRPICLLGPVGSGKSTLMRYYLRSYSPRLGIRRADAHKMLVLFFDAKSIQDNVNFSHDFFLLLQSVIRHECSQKEFDIDERIKRRPTAPQNIRQWVRGALEELSRALKKAEDKADLPFRYIVLVVDNLDQTSIEVQIRAITEIDQWFKTPTIDLWRVFLPMWPSTFRKLQNHQFNLLRGAESLEVAPISASALLANRENAAMARIASLNESSASAAAEYLSTMFSVARERLILRIHSLAASNLRQMLWLWEAFVCGESAFSIYKEYQQSSADGHRSFDYELADALYVGSHDALDHREHRIANLLAMGHAHARPRNLLIGPHAVCLLAQNRQTQEELARSLTALGYSEQNFAEAEKSMIAFNFFHQTPSRHGSIEYEIHHEVVNEYLRLQLEPAYVDNIALVTPVHPRYHPRMTQTRGDRADDFTRRVETTLAFLTFLRECEDQFRSVDRLKRTTADIFARALDDLRIPCLWKRMAVRYLDRLIGLRRSGFLKQIDAKWWDAAIADSIFAHADREEEYLSAKP